MSHFYCFWLISAHVPAILEKALINDLIAEPAAYQCVGFHLTVNIKRVHILFQITQVIIICCGTLLVDINLFRNVLMIVPLLNELLIAHIE